MESQGEALERLKQQYPDKPITQSILPLMVGGVLEKLRVVDTGDFSCMDPWAMFSKESTIKFGEKGHLKNGNNEPFDRVLELGIGAAGNILALSKVLPGLRIVQGIDIEQWRLDLADVNLKRYLPNIGLQLIRGDAVEYLHHYDDDDVISGLVIMCLPQSIQTNNDSVADVQSNHYENVPEMFKDHGLELNYAALEALGKVSTDDTRVNITLSERIAPELHEQMFAETGWEKLDVNRTMVQQDPDTDLSWMQEAVNEGRMGDNGKRFYRKLVIDDTMSDALDYVIIDGEFYEPMSIKDAIAYQDNVEVQFGDDMDADVARQDFNLYHGLSVYCLQKKAA